MTTDGYIKNYVYDGVINEYAKLMKIPPREALDTLYRSHLYTQIRRGVSDMHCRGDLYLAEELMLETTGGSYYANTSPASSSGSTILPSL